MYFPLCHWLQGKPIHDQSLPLLNSWTGVLFKFCGICSPITRLLILARDIICSQNLFPKCIRLVEMVFCQVLMLNFVVKSEERFISDGFFMKATLVQESLNSWTMYYNSRACQIYLVVFSSQTAILSTGSFSNNPWAVLSALLDWYENWSVKCHLWQKNLTP